MTYVRAIADTSPTRNHLRLVVLAQWIAAGIALIRGATTTGRGLVGGAVALWRLAQAVRLAILREAQGAPRASASGPPSTPVPTWSLDAAPLDDDALRRAMAELDAAVANALGGAPQGRASLWDRAWDSVWDRARPARIFARASQAARGPNRRPHRRRTPPLGLRPLRPPGPVTRPAKIAQAGRPGRDPDPDRPPAIGRDPLAKGQRRRAQALARPLAAIRPSASASLTTSAYLACRSNRLASCGRGSRSPQASRTT